MLIQQFVIQNLADAIAGLSLVVSLWALRAQQRIAQDAKKFAAKLAQDGEQKREAERVLQLSQKYIEQIVSMEDRVQQIVSPLLTHAHFALNDVAGQVYAMEMRTDERPIPTAEEAFYDCINSVNNRLFMHLPYLNGSQTNVIILGLTQILPQDLFTSDDGSLRCRTFIYAESDFARGMETLFALGNCSVGGDLLGLLEIAKDRAAKLLQAQEGCAKELSTIKVEIGHALRLNEAEGTTIPDDVRARFHLLDKEIDLLVNLRPHVTGDGRPRDMIVPYAVYLGVIASSLSYLGQLLQRKVSSRMMALWPYYTQRHPDQQQKAR